MDADPFHWTSVPPPPAPPHDEAHEALSRALPRVPSALRDIPLPEITADENEVYEDDMVDSSAHGELDETAFAQLRQPNRTYVHRSFTVDKPWSEDFGKPARFIAKVIDTHDETEVVLDGNEWLIRATPKGRYQFKLLVAREAGAVRDIWIQRVPPPGSRGRVKKLLHLRQPEAGRLIELLRHLDSIPIEGPRSVQVDDELVRDIFTSPQSLKEVYDRNPDGLRRLIAEDEYREDVVALAHRRRQVRRFKRLLNDPDYFAYERSNIRGAGNEKVWRRFFEGNPWIFGVALTGQLLTSWNHEKLEQTVSGAHIGGVGKRTDALLRTNGRIRSMVFAEFKTHEDDLLDDEYRSGCWSPSEELSDGVAQAQGTVYRAVRDIGERLADLAADRSELPGEFTYLIRPRSFLVIGQLSSLLGQGGGGHLDRVRSFEIYRRSLVEPEVVTFDELLARAEWFTSPTATE